MRGSPPGRLRRLLPEIPATMAAFVVAVVAEVGLRTTTLPRLAKFLGTPLAIDAGPQVAVMDAPAEVELTLRDRRRVSATRRALRHWPFGDTCLRQALISGQRLRHLDPVLQLGVARIDGEIRAHAWLVVGGAILDPRSAARDYLDLRTPHQEEPG